MNFRVCNHRDETNRSTLTEKRAWFVGKRKVVEEECSKCRRIMRHRPGQNEYQLSGRTGRLKGQPNATHRGVRRARRHHMPGTNVRAGSGASAA